jgi:hypothetical protein
MTSISGSVTKAALQPFFRDGSKLVDNRHPGSSTASHRNSNRGVGRRRTGKRHNHYRTPVLVDEVAGNDHTWLGLASAEPHVGSRATHETSPRRGVTPRLLYRVTNLVPLLFDCFHVGLIVRGEV